MQEADCCDASDTGENCDAKDGTTGLVCTYKDSRGRSMTCHSPNQPDLETNKALSRRKIAESLIKAEFAVLGGDLPPLEEHPEPPAEAAPPQAGAASEGDVEK